mmetsp:Transcript_28222/g.31729  ORF Transcript_28222/g.31729 Transcript_28222/m.31729 type:complete len:225 (+) Transcript_28222:110-784(+)
MALRSSGRCRSINTRSRKSSNTLVDFVLLLQSLTLALLCLSCLFDSSTTSSTSTSTSTTTSSTTTVLQVQALAAANFRLTPHTLPIDILERQLVALQLNDMIGAYRLASPANQAGSGNNVTNFGKMVRAPPYSPLVRHKKAQILLESRMFDSQQFLVRVVSSSSSPDLEEEEEDEDEESACSPSQKKRRKTTNKVSEYWWSLSRSNSGPAGGSYMVDAVIPNRM